MDIGKIERVEVREIPIRIPDAKPERAPGPRKEPAPQQKPEKVPA